MPSWKAGTWPGETAQVAEGTAEGEGGPRAGICGCSEGCWQHAPDRPDQNEAARHGSGEYGEGERREGGKATRQSPKLHCVQTGPCTGPQHTSKMHTRCTETQYSAVQAQETKERQEKGKAAGPT